MTNGDAKHPIQILTNIQYLGEIIGIIMEETGLSILSNYRKGFNNIPGRPNAWKWWKGF